MNLLDLLKTDMVKTLATIFLFCVVMSALVLYVFDTITNRAIPQSVTDVLVGAITACLPLVGLHQGVTIANGVAKETASATVDATIKATTSGQLNTLHEEETKNVS